MKDGECIGCGAGKFEIHRVDCSLDIRHHDLSAQAPKSIGDIRATMILRHAAELIEHRAAQRDQPNGEKTMANTVKAFNAIYGTSLTEVQGWHFMELLKMVRSAYGVYVADDFEDKVAYAALAAEAAEVKP